MTLKRAAAVAVATLLLGLLTAGALAWHAGYRVYAVQTGSMEPTVQPGDLVVDRSVEDGGYGPGDVITFHHSTGPDVVTHRISDISPQGIHTKGDGNRSKDSWDIRPGQVVGVGVSQLADMGYVLVFLKQPTAVAGVMTSGLSLVLLWGIFFPAGPTPAPVTTREAEAARPARKPRRHLLQGA